MPPRKSVLSGRVGKKRRSSLSSQFSDLKVASPAQEQPDVPMDTAENIQQIRTVYKIKSNMLDMRANGTRSTFIVDHQGGTHRVSDHSINAYQLNAFIIELEEQIMNLSTRLRYHKSRFSMTTRSQRRWAKLIEMQRYDSHFMLTHQKELQDGQELLESLKEELSHVSMLEGKDDRFERLDTRFKQRTRRSVSV